MAEFNQQEIAQLRQDLEGLRWKIDRLQGPKILAYVNYNAEDGTIRTSYNVASVTVVSTGVFDIAFSRPMKDINYTVLATISPRVPTGTTCPGVVYIHGTKGAELAPTTSQFRVSSYSSGTFTEYPFKYLSIMVVE